MADELKVGGDALAEMLKDIDVDSGIRDIRSAIPNTTSVSKKDTMIKKLKYLSGLKKLGMKAEDAYILRNVPVLPPTSRPVMIQSGNRIEFSDVNQLYRDHMLVNKSLGDIKDFLPPEELINERKALYDGVKAIAGLGDAISGASRGRNLKGLLQQVAGTTGPKTGYFHSKVLSKKQDFSGRGTIYSKPDIGFNEMAMPIDSLWTMYKFHIIRDLVKKGYHYVDAEKAWETRNPSASDSFNKLIKTVPVIVNRAPTLMRSNISAFHPVPTEGTGLGVNPLHLPLFAGDYDGDAVSMFLPMTPEAIKEAKENMLPQHQLYDYRKGVGQTLVSPGHEAIIGSVHMTEPDMKQKTEEFESEADVLKALKEGKIRDNTPIIITGKK